MQTISRQHAASEQADTQARRNTTHAHTRRSTYLERIPERERRLLRILCTEEPPLHRLRQRRRLVQQCRQPAAQLLAGRPAVSDLSRILTISFIGCKKNIQISFRVSEQFGIDSYPQIR